MKVFMKPRFFLKSTQLEHIQNLEVLFQNRPGSEPVCNSVQFRPGARALLRRRMGGVGAEGPGGRDCDPGLGRDRKVSLPLSYWGLKAPACAQLGLFGIWGGGRRAE